MGYTEITVPSLSQAHTKARRLAKKYGIRWAASWMAALGLPVETALEVLLAKDGKLSSWR